MPPISTTATAPPTKLWQCTKPTSLDRTKWLRPMQRTHSTHFFLSTWLSNQIKPLHPSSKPFVLQIDAEALKTTNDNQDPDQSPEQHDITQNHKQDITQKSLWFNYQSAPNQPYSPTTICLLKQFWICTTLPMSTTYLWPVLEQTKISRLYQNKQYALSFNSSMVQFIIHLAICKRSPKSPIIISGLLQQQPGQTGHAQPPSTKPILTKIVQFQDLPKQACNDPISISFMFLPR